jgi:choline kinase
VIGLVLAAGSGRRLMPYTENLPKTLLPVSDDRTIMNVILDNLAGAGLTDIAVVVGHAAGVVERRRSELERRHGVRLSLIRNDRVDWNNAYSLWLVRDLFPEGVLLVNGDTVHPVAIEHTLLANRDTGVSLAVDPARRLTDEAMKVLLDPSDRVIRIAKGLPAEQAHGEYLGVAIIEPAIAKDLADCLESTWTHDPGQYYEDGLQLLADGNRAVRAVRVDPVDWVEVDDVADLSRARELVRGYQPEPLSSPGRPS